MDFSQFRANFFSTLEKTEQFWLTWVGPRGQHLGPNGCASWVPKLNRNNLLIEVGGQKCFGGKLGGWNCSEKEKKIPEKSGLVVGHFFLLSYYTSIQDGHSGQISDCSAVGFNCCASFKFGQIRFFGPKWSNDFSLDFEKNIFSRSNWSRHLYQISGFWPVGKYLSKIIKLLARTHYSTSRISGQPTIDRLVATRFLSIFSIVENPDQDHLSRFQTSATIGRDFRSHQEVKC